MEVGTNALHWLGRDLPVSRHLHTLSKTVESQRTSRDKTTQLRNQFVFHHHFRAEYTTHLPPVFFVLPGFGLIVKKLPPGAMSVRPYSQYIDTR